jgi:4-hydroxy-3-methylbut-2-enyl diphosphate reductase
MMKRTVQVANQADYCFGVRRALDLALENLSDETRNVYSLGPIIHNPQVVEEFRRKGMIPIDSIDEIDEGVLVIRSHGVEKDLLDRASEKGLEVVDATCPFVKNAQTLARKLSEEGYQVVIVGESAHPEVKGILSYAGDDPIVVKEAWELKAEEVGSKVGVLSQTTKRKENFVEVVKAVSGLSHECRAFNTICNATLSRQASAVELAETVDVMLVVGGKNSANTRRLAELCCSAGCEAFQIEVPDEITPHMLRGKRRVGIAAGASTPRSQVDAVKKACEKSNY